MLCLKTWCKNVFFSPALSLELSTISECLHFTVAVHCREWNWKASIFIQCLCGADILDWLNACHIDTPVVSLMGPQRHNGVGSAWPYAMRLLSVSICPRLLILLLVDFTMLMILCDFIKWNLGLNQPDLFWVVFSQVYDASRRISAALFRCTLCVILLWMGKFSFDFMFAFIIVCPASNGC